MVKKTTSRHGFTARTRDKIAARAGYRCSRLECGKPTSGPNSDPEKAVDLGVAAHIHAASRGGPRYDPSQTEKERKNIENAIWLCQSCSVLVDRDPLRYTADMLRAWKTEAESRAYQQMTDGISTAAPVTWPEHPLDRFHQLLKNPSEWMSVPGERFYYYHCLASDYVISEGDVVNEDFAERWTTRFPDPRAWSVNVNYLCRSTMVKSSVFVVVDGGRYTVPMPKMTPGGSGLEYSIEELSIEWKTALLFKQYLSDIKEQLRHVGVQVIGERM
jgi:hypothetical protein